MSSIEVQKHVGQTMVQLPHVRHRAATSSQRAALGAVHRDDEHPGAPLRLPRAGLGEDPVLDGDRPQVARPDAEERVPRRLVVVAGHLEAFPGTRG